MCIRDRHGRGDCVPADGGHGLQNQQSCLWKQTAAHKTPGQGQHTGRVVSLLALDYAKRQLEKANIARLQSA